MAVVREHCGDDGEEYRGPGGGLVSGYGGVEVVVLGAESRGGDRDSADCCCVAVEARYLEFEWGAEWRGGEAGASGLHGGGVHDEYDPLLSAAAADRGRSGGVVASVDIRVAGRSVCLWGGVCGCGGEVRTGTDHSVGFVSESGCGSFDVRHDHSDGGADCGMLDPRRIVYGYSSEQLMFSIPLYFQVTQGASNTIAGAHLFPAVAGNAVGGLLAGAAIRR